MAMPESACVLRPRDAFLKRTLDLTLAVVGLALTGWLILAAYVISSIDTRQNGFFCQERVGRYGRRFRVIKIRTMGPGMGINTCVTIAGDPRITQVGRFFRRTKIDELPQLINVLLGDMSFVGPRPDVPGYADLLQGESRAVLTVRPGITGPATLKYRDEEVILAQQTDPERYNREVLYPDKVLINLEYINQYRFWDDLRYLWRTIFH